MLNQVHGLALRLQEAEGSGGGFLSNLPSDPASVFVLILVVGAVAVVIYSGRSGRGGGTKTP